VSAGTADSAGASDEGDVGTGPAAAAPDAGDEDDDDDKDEVWYLLRASRADASSDTSSALDCSTISALHWKCFERALYFAFTYTAHSHHSLYRRCNKR